jgi:hypothetical protein
MHCDLLAARGTAVQTGEPIEWPTDPAAVVAGPLSDLIATPSESEETSRYALVAHKFGAASIFLEHPSAGATSPERFELSAAVGGLPQPLTNIEVDTASHLAHLTVGSRGLARVGFAPQPEGVESDRDGTLYSAGSLSIEALSSLPDTRDLTFFPAMPDAGEALATQSALVVADNPASLLLVDVQPETPGSNRARIKRTAVVGIGASRVAAGTLRGRPTAIVACFDARELFVIDLETMLTRSVVPNLSGPFELLFDEARERVYVADFRSSVIRIVDLSELAETQGEASARVVATLGAPRVLQELR